MEPDHVSPLLTALQWLPPTFWIKNARFLKNVSPLPSSPTFSPSPLTHYTTCITHTHIHTRHGVFAAHSICLAWCTWQTHLPPRKSCSGVVSPWSVLWTAIVNYTQISKSSEFLKFHKFPCLQFFSTATLCKLLRCRDHFSLGGHHTYYGPVQRSTW